jgi:hypothetical protein
MELGFQNNSLLMEDEVNFVWESKGVAKRKLLAAKLWC